MYKYIFTDKIKTTIEQFKKGKQTATLIALLDI